MPNSLFRGGLVLEAHRLLYNSTLGWRVINKNSIPEEVAFFVVTADAVRLERVLLTIRSHPGVELRANLKSISHRCNLFEVAFVWELTKETIHLPQGCLQGGFSSLLLSSLELSDTQSL